MSYQPGKSLSFPGFVNATSIMDDVLVYLFETFGHYYVYIQIVLLPLCRGHHIAQCSLILQLHGSFMRKIYNF